MRSKNYYPGNKAIPGLLHKIINQIPPFLKFYEPFAGSAAVSKFLSVRSMAGVQFFINDIDPAVTASQVYPAGSIVSNVSAFTILDELISTMAGNDVFVFLDPPYLKSTRPNSQDLYNFDLSDHSHKFLFSQVKHLKCNCMIIHPKCWEYDHAFTGWRQVPVTVRYHSKTSHEILYMNYPDPIQLHTAALAGTDCWDRQRIQRKAQRTVKRFLSMPAAERQYILSQLQKLIIVPYGEKPLTFHS